MTWFKRREDPLAMELRRIERKRRELEKESRLLHRSSGLPPEPMPVVQESPRGAIFLNPDEGVGTDPGFRPRTPVELRILQRRQRNRFLIIAGLIVILLLMIVRTLA